MDLIVVAVVAVAVGSVVSGELDAVKLLGALIVAVAVAKGGAVTTRIGVAVVVGSEDPGTPLLPPLLLPRLNGVVAARPGGDGSGGEAALLWWWWWWSFLFAASVVVDVVETAECVACFPIMVSKSNESHHQGYSRRTLTSGAVVWL